MPAGRASQRRQTMSPVWRRAGLPLALFTRSFIFPPSSSTLPRRPGSHAAFLSAGSHWSQLIPRDQDRISAAAGFGHVRYILSTVSLPLYASRPAPYHRELKISAGGPPRLVPVPDPNGFPYQIAGTGPRDQAPKPSSMTAPGDPPRGPRRRAPAAVTGGRRDILPKFSQSHCLQPPDLVSGRSIRRAA
ncbi:hypothetical protein CLV41_101404 [Roseibium marinum]|uniref:Uncharacterized protein n=1 Tax=Roseibium marinum TaxID=281252 RepID=A0A2S3V1V1_9HYPH|nr:hypothetical protein CLV41_101404 [Roseibium marinum]